MIYWLAGLFARFGWKFPPAFLYTSTRMAFAAVTALLLSILLGPTMIRKLYAWRIGQPIRKEECPLLGELHAKKEDTPTMGGALILGSMMVALVLWMDLRQSTTLLLGITTLWLGLLGAIDDSFKLKKRNSKGMPGKVKLGLQMLLCGLLALYFLVPGVAETIHVGQWFAPNGAKWRGEWLSLSEYMRLWFIPFVKNPVWIFHGVGVLLLVVIMVGVVAGSSNAVNLTDGLDGLAAGTMIMATAPFILFAFVANHLSMASYLHIPYVEGSGEIAVFLCALVGGCLGFLFYNGHPAQVFMGDTGSLMMGGVLGLSALMLKRELLLAIVGGVFVVEALSVILQVGSYRLRGGKRIFLCAPLHHHFEYMGWAETKVVMRFWIAGFLLSAIGAASLKLQ